MHALVGYSAFNMYQYMNYFYIYSLSFILYDISHPNKLGVPQVDLSDDNEASVDESSLATKQAVVERVIAKIFTRYKCDVIITERLRTLFSAKLWRMGKAVSSLGGTARTNMFEKWKTTHWTIELQENEIFQPQDYHSSTNVVIPTKRKRVAKIEEDLRVANKKLKELTKEYNELKKSCKTLSSTLANAPSSSTETTPKRRIKKAWEHCSTQYQKKRTRETIKNINTALTYTADEDFKPTKLEITNKSTGDVILCTEQNGELAPAPKKTSTSRVSDEVMNQTLYIKEKFNMSNQTYHALTQVHKELPQTNSIIKTAKKMNEGYTIRPIPGTFKGVQQSLKDHLKTIIEKRNYVPESNTIKVKLTGDGTVVSRNVHLVVIAYTIIDTHGNPNSHTIALITTTEIMIICQNL